jgi:hypothetical protein
MMQKDKEYIQNLEENYTALFQVAFIILEDKTGIVVLSKNGEKIGVFKNIQLMPAIQVYPLPSDMKTIEVGSILRMFATAEEKSEFEINNPELELTDIVQPSATSEEVRSEISSLISKVEKGEKL